MNNRFSFLIAVVLLSVGMASPSHAEMIMLSFQSTGSGSVSNKNFLGAPAVAGDSSRGFSGTASVGEFVDIDSFDTDGDSGVHSWTLRYLVNEPLNSVAFTASDRADVHVFTNFNATSDASASTALSLVGFPVSPFVHSSTSEQCSSTFSDCTDSNGDSDSNYYVFPFSTTPFIVELSGTGFVLVSVDSFNGSAEASSSVSTSWSLKPLPEPSTIWIFIPALLMMIALRRRFSRNGDS